MYTKVADHVYLGNSADERFPAISMADANAVQVEWVVITYSGSGNISATIEESNDLENWSAVGSADTQSAVGYSTFTRPDQTSPGGRIASAFVRLKLEAAASAVAVVAAGVNTAQI